nr:hypothetical protein [uncultured Arsenicibacter sp.]
MLQLMKFPFLKIIKIIAEVVGVLAMVRRENSEKTADWIADKLNKNKDVFEEPEFERFRNKQIAADVLDILSTILKDKKDGLTREDALELARQLHQREKERVSDRMRGVRQIALDRKKAEAEQAEAIKNDADSPAENPQ